MCLVIWKMVSSAMTTWYNNNGLRTRVILDFVDQNVGWGMLHDILHIVKKETLRGGHFMTYYTSSKYYGRTRMHVCSTCTRHKKDKEDFKSKNVTFHSACKPTVASKTFFKVSISYRTQPRAHMSLFWLYLQWYYWILSCGLGVS